MKPLATDLLRATPIFATAVGLAFVGLTILICAEQAVEMGCLIISRK